MNVNTITEKILSDARADAETVLADARNKADQAAATVLAEADRKVAQIQQDSLNEMEETYRRQGLIAELEGRKMALAKKHEVLDEAFAQAYRELANLPEAKWEALITRIVLSCTETGAETLRVPAKDLARYRNGYLSKLNASLVAAGKVGKLTLDETPASFADGVALIGEASEVNGSLDALLKETRESCERDIANILFAAEGQ